MANGTAVSGNSLSMIAQRLRAAREQSRYTLEELAALTGLSKAHLSRLESGERQPSIAALLTFAGALNVPVAWLLGEDINQPARSLAIYAPNEATHQVAGLCVSPSSGYPGSGAIEALRMRISPDRQRGMPTRHRGEEWVYVVKGTLCLEHDGRQELVHRDRSAHFDAQVPHRLAAHGSPCEVIVVTAPGSVAFLSAHRLAGQLQAH